MGIDRDAYREQSLATWAEMAPGWEARHDWLVEATGVVNDWIVAAADPRPGQVFLDVAAGPGDLGHQVAERVGAEGRVISSDFAPEMVDVARRFAEGRGLDNVEHRVLDAERMDLPDDSVDGVVCRFGFMLMADAAAALRETRRVLRAGGALTFAVWSTADRNPWAAMPAMTLVQRGHLALPEPDAPGIFSMGDPGRINELVTSAGFAEAQPDEIAFDFRYADFEDVWDALVRLAGPLARAVTALPDAEREATRSAIKQNVDAYRNPDGSYSVAASAWGVHVR
jgi:ubiquinone/menaquinone biosynthesis C-methylase UbiE